MTTPSQAQMDQIVNDHFRYEATDDVDGVMGTLTDDAVHEVVGGPDGPVKGKAAIRGFYERLFADIKGEGIKPVVRLYGDNFITDVTLWTGRVLNGRPFKLDGKTGKVSIRLLHIFRLRGNKIENENLWFDHDALKNQLA